MIVINKISFIMIYLTYCIKKSMTFPHSSKTLHRLLIQNEWKYAFRLHTFNVEVII